MADPNDYAARHRERANVALELGRYRAAEQEARGALSHDPRDVASWIVLSRALIGQDRDADGESAAQEAVRVNPLEPHGHFLVGFARQRMSDPWGSVPPMREAVRLAPWWAPYPARLAIALAETGEPEEARRLAQQAIALRPDDPYPHSNAALTYNVLGEYPTAEAYIRRAISLAPAEYDHHRILAETLRLQLRHADSLVAARESVRINPNFGTAWMETGAALYFLGRLEEAESAVREALRLRPGYWLSLEFLSDILMARGRPQDALAAMRGALADRKPDTRLQGRLRDLERRIAAR